MDVGKVATLYIHGSEKAVAGNEMLMTATLKQPYSKDVLTRAYRRFVEENPTIASKFVEEGEGFGWQPFSREEREARLALEEHDLAELHEMATLHDVYHPTNERLPFRIVPVGPSTLVFCVNHAFSNGRGLIAWTSRFFEAYARELGEVVEAREHPTKTTPSALGRFFAAIVGLYWTIVYLIGFMSRAGKNAATETVDLGNKSGEPLCRAGFAVKTYRLSPEETSALVATAKARGLTVGQHLASVLTELFLDAQPERRRVNISMPIDLRGELPHLSVFALGNYTGSLVVQAHRGLPAGAQVRAAWRWFARRVPYWLGWIVGRSTERKLFQHFVTQAGKPNAARAPIENFTFALSSMGRIEDPVLAHFLEDISGHTRTQTIFGGLATFNGRLSLEFSFARDLYPAESVFRVLDRLPARALQTGSAAEDRETEPARAAA